MALYSDQLEIQLKEIKLEIINLFKIKEKYEEFTY